VRSPLGRFDNAPPDAALASMREVCASADWAAALIARRPYGTLDALLAEADRATAALTDTQLDEAVAGHAPIGDPEPADPVAAREQSGVAGAPAALRAQLRDLNRAYLLKFGRVFLLCATGASAEDVCDALRDRLGNGPERERDAVRAELAGINRLRLARLMAPVPTVSTHVLDTSAGRPAVGVGVALAARTGAQAPWQELGTRTTDTDGRCAELPALPEGTREVRLVFATGPYLLAPPTTQAPASAEAQQDAPAPRDSGPFFPEVTVAIAVAPGEHFHVPLLLNPFGYSVYRGS
jgi:2-oxo-4-hydroxy-4-carboxy-5-ureidoimidazoline decarboxylase